MTKYYTRACNFFYGQDSRKLVKKKLTLPLCNDSSISFNQIEIFSRDKKKITTTHSYYDCSKTKDFVKTQIDQEYSCSIPFNIINEIDLEIVIYPIFSKCNIEFDLEKFSEDGKRFVLKKNILRISKNFKKPVYLGDTVTATAKVKSIDIDKRRVFFDTSCTVKNKVVISGMAELYVP